MRKTKLTDKDKIDILKESISLFEMQMSGLIFVLDGKKENKESIEYLRNILYIHKRRAAYLKDTFGV